MSDAFMEKMFTKFERETDTWINSYGLGLPIVKKLVDLMGGTIEVQSCVGEGTTFCIRLEVPYVKRHEAEKSETQIDYSAACAGMHLLVAEDNVLNREVITELLEMHDITCTCAGDGAVCLRCLKTAPYGTYDAILMDVQMPVANGIDATKQIRALLYAWAEKIPIIAMTENVMKDDVQICMEAGMNRHLSKSIEMKLLLKTLVETI